MGFPSSWFRLLAAVCALVALTCIARPCRAETYTIGIVPQFEQRKLYAIWKPIVDELQRRTGHTFTWATTLTIRDFERDFLAGKFDFAYMNPYHVLKAHKSQGYIPLACDTMPLRGILVVRRDSPINKVKELNGKTIAFPSPNAFGASLLMRADLQRLFHVTIKPLYVKTHSSVYLHVASGLVPAGGGVEKTLAQQDPQVRDLLRVLYTTREPPSHPLVAHPRVPAQHRDAVSRAFISLAQTTEGKELLAKVPIQSLRKAGIEDYLPMRNWGLDKFWDHSWKDD